MVKKPIKKSDRLYRIDKVSPEEDRFVVTFSVHENGVEQQTIVQGFPLDADVEAEVKKAAELYFVEREMAVKDRERTEKEQAAKAIADNLTGKEGAI